MFWQNHRIELAREATAQERDRAQQVSAFLVDVFSQADPFNAQGNEPTAKDLLDRGAEKISGNLSLQPEVRAQLLESIGLAYRRQGLSERAIPLFEQAVAIRRQERPLDNGHIAVALANLARALTDAGHLVSARGLSAAGGDLVGERRRTRAPSRPPTSWCNSATSRWMPRAIPRAPPSSSARRSTSTAATLGNQNLQVAATLNGLAAAAVWMDDYPVAEHYQREALGYFPSDRQPQPSRPRGRLGDAWATS